MVVTLEIALTAKITGGSNRPTHKGLKMEQASAEVMYILGEIRADMKNLLSKSVDQDTRLNSHSERITNVERFQYKLAGAAVAVSTAIGIALRLL